ncbi:MAG: anthranilate synthase component I [Pirellulaceae bacterium]|nr:anthranilate synthase component I [Pirellulaceae bacterium]
MKTIPDLDSFRQLASQYDLVPVYRRLLSDTLTPVSAFRLLDDGISGACLFESVVGGERVGRYSFVATQPHARFAAWGEKTLWQSGDTRQESTLPDPLSFIQQQLTNRNVAPIPDLPPFLGGAIGYMAYDVIRYVEHLPNPPADDRKLPDIDVGFFHHLLVFDNITKTLLIVSLVAPKDFASPDAAYQDAQQKIQKTVDQLSQKLPDTKPADISLTGKPTLKAKSNFSQDKFEAAVRTCNEYIRAGDIFQVVISQRFEVDCDCSPIEIYRSLRVINPSPFMFFLRTPHAVLVGSSPEVMCRVVDSQITVRPLAGTRPRGKTVEEDRKLAAELLADPKERAEHVMLVDLGRNDVGRVAKFGSVKLSNVMEVERYSHVMHISSNVEGTLRDDLTCMDAFKAALPAGTVSGAPKVRAMEIIDAIEPTRRGPYAGAVGYFDYRGNMDTCIALRTMVICGGKIYIQAGAGLVADSDPASEYQETMNKANAMLKAIEVTRSRRNGE